MKEFYSRVLANGDIYRADYEGLYCVNCEEYKVLLAIEVVTGRSKPFVNLIAVTCLITSISFRS